MLLPCLPNIKVTCNATYISLRYFCPYTILFASSFTFSCAKLFVTDCWKISWRIVPTSVWREPDSEPCNRCYITHVYMWRFTPTSLKLTYKISWFYLLHNGLHLFNSKTIRAFTSLISVQTWLWKQTVWNGSLPLYLSVLSEPW